MKKNLPNAITLLNLWCGCLALAAAFRGDVNGIVLWTVAAAVADFLDGATARWLKVQSPLGAQLDSLADAVSFGVVPGAIFYFMLGGIAAPEFSFAAVPGFLISVFAVLRLARFNLDTRQHEHFIGLPTPAATMFALGWLLIVHTDALGWSGVLGQPLIIYSGIAALCLLMNAELPMFSLKFKSLGWRGNEIRIIFVAGSLLLLLLLRSAAPLLIIGAYIIVSLILHWFTPKRKL
jgi:CDP-diacylglycerol--serine O-phosphatidyltransferase